MPDLYVDSSIGADAPGNGDSTAAPLRSLTFAVEETARRFGASRTTIHLAAGTYGTATGEVFPIEMAQNISVAGAGRALTIVEFARSILSGFDVALSGGEELTGFTLRGTPLGPSGCYLSYGIWLTMGSSYVHDLAIEIAPGSPADEEAFGKGIVAENSARIEDVQISGCHYGIWCPTGDVRIARCTLASSFKGILASTRGVVQDCTFDGCHQGIDVASGVDVTVSGCRFDRCTWAVWVAAGVSAGLLPVVRGNQVSVGFYGIGCWGAALVEDNDIVVPQDGIGIAVDCGFPARRSADVPPPASSPTFRNNRIGRTVPYDPSHRTLPAALFGDASTPVLQGNRFWADAGFRFATIWVSNDALPDLGGGSGGSTGGNRFEAGWLVFYQDDLSPPKDVYAQNNAWRYATRGWDRWATGDYYVDPRERRDSVVLHMEGAVTF